MDYEFIRQRITQLRIKKNVSEYQMSLEMGHSKNYMHHISSGQSKPSIEEFLYICEYLGVTPRDFFAEDRANPVLIQKALDGMQGLSDKDLLILLNLIERLKEAP